MINLRGVRVELLELEVEEEIETGTFREDEVALVEADRTEGISRLSEG